MKKLLLLLFTIASFNAKLTAQSNWSVGFRTGTELIKKWDEWGKVNPLFSQQLFLTKRIIKSLEVELNCSYKFPITSYSAGQTFDGPEFYSSNTTTHILEAAIFARYYILNSKDWHPYIMLGTSSITQFSTISQYYTEIYTGRPISDYRKNTETKFPCLYSFGIGVNKTIAKNWKVNSQFLIAYDYPGFTFSYNNEFTPKLQFGLAYCW